MWKKKTSLKMQGSDILKRHSEWYRTKLGFVTKRTEYNTLVLKIKTRDIK